MKKTIQTNRVRMWQKVDRLVFLVPVVVFLYLTLGSGIVLGLWGDMAATAALTPSTIGSMALILLLSPAYLSLPIVLIWRAITHSAKKAAMRSTTFRAIEDFDYYRETLTGVTPTAISLLVDLKLEFKKDAAALLLRYTKMGVVSMEGQTLTVLNDQHPGLLPSDRTLLSLLTGEAGPQPGDIAAWKSQAEGEAIAAGYLRYRGHRERPDPRSGCFKGCCSGCLLPLLLGLGLVALVPKVLSPGTLERMQRVIDATPTDLDPSQSVQLMLSSPELLKDTAILLTMALPLIAILVLPLAALFRMIFSSGEVLYLKRTEAGEVLTEQIAGIKNFLRDFSELSQAEKEQLLLWDDFLIYAVVLEENTRITEDIFSMKGLHYQDFVRF